MSIDRINHLATDSKTLKLLYVEDNEMARKSTLQVLEIFFDDIVIAEDGEDGLEKFKNNTFDIIITDINMPNMNGIEMVTEIRKSNKNITIIVLSAHNETSYLLEAIEQGLDGYLLKPIHTEQFINLLEKSVKNLVAHKKIKDYQNNLEQKVLEQTKKIKENLYHDSLTGLKNFMQLEEDLKEGDFKTLYILDVTKFSVFFKQYGLNFSNKLLQVITKSLQKHIQQDMKLYKIESDKFIILAHHTSTLQIKEFCKQIISYHDFSNMQIDDVELCITFCLGISHIKENEDPLINSGYALSSAKKMGARYCSFSDISGKDLDEEKEKIRWLSITKKLIEEENIIPYYQAIVDVNTQKVIKHEVLARGIIDGKIIDPVFFLEAAQQLGLISSISKIIIQKSFQFFANTQHNFSINIAQRDLLEGYLPEFLVQKLEYYNISASSVTIEILESITLLKDSKIITEQLNLLEEIGFQIAIDDFGVENSNFSHLVDININIIKIDGFFIKNIVNNEKGQKIVKAIVNLAKALEIKTVAEFVETQEIFEMVKDLGVDYAQGYYFSIPKNSLLD